VTTLLRQAVAAREFYIKKVIAKELKQREAEEILGVSSVTLWKWKSRYLQFGERGLLPEKPGPKAGGKAHNRTPAETEDLVVRLAGAHPSQEQVSGGEKW